MATHAYWPEAELALLWAFMLSPISIATCTCHDVHSSLKNTFVSPSESLFYLDRFPCRRAKITGLCVGVTIGENRVIYSIDDGTAVLDCICWSRSMPQELGKKRGWQEKSVFRVGQVLEVVGRVESFREERQLNVVSLGMSHSSPSTRR